MPDSADNNGNSKPKKRGRIENLKPYPKGVSGNPGGRPKKKPITEMYEDILGDEPTMALFKQAVIKAVASGRMSSMFQLKEMAERVEGKVTQPVDVNGDVFLSLAERMKKARERRNAK